MKEKRRKHVRDRRRVWRTGVVARARARDA